MSSQRKHERYRYKQDVVLIFDDGEEHFCQTKDFSLGGTFIHVVPQPEFGSKVVLRIDLPGVPDTCEIPCFVRWVKDRVGVGIQFEYTRPIEVWSLSKLVRRLKEEDSGE